MTALFSLLLPLLLLALSGVATVYWTGRKTTHVLDIPLLFLTGALALPTVLGLLLADLNHFSILWIWFVVILLFVSGICLHRKEVSWNVPRKWVGGLAFAGLLLSILFSRPFEYLLGGWDPGEYVSTAAHIERTGGLDYIEPFLIDLPEELEPRFFRKWVLPRQTFHAGYLVVNVDTGEMVPDYFHLYPVWLALFTSHGTLELAYMSQTVLAVLGSLLFLLSCARLTSLRLSFLIGFFWITQSAVLFFGRFTSSEFLSIGLLFGIIAIWKMQEDRADLSRTFWIGLLVFGAVTCHITNLLPLAGLGMMGVLLGFKSLLTTPGRELLTLGTATGLGILRNVKGTPVFSEHLIQEYVFEEPTKVVPIVLLPLLLGGIGWLVWKTFGERILASKGVNIALRWVPAMLLLLAGLYQYFLRMKVDPGHNALNLQSLGWVVSPMGLILAFGALFTINWRKTDRVLLMLFMAGIISAGVLLHHKNIQPVYYWAYRRYLPMVFPLLALLMAWGIEQAWNSRWKIWLGPLVSLLGLSPAGWQILASVPTVRVQEHRGLADYVSEVAATLSDAGFVVVDHWKLATPLRHGFGIPAYSLTQESSSLQGKDQPLLHRFLQEQVQQHPPAYYLTHSSPFAAPGIRLEKVSSHSHQSEKLEWRRNSLPRNPVQTQSTANLYRMTPEDLPYPAENGPIELAVGYHSLGLIRGFYEHTSSRGRSYRWTDGNAALYVPAFDTPSTLTLSLAHMRPDQLGSEVDVTLTLDGAPLKTLTLGPGWNEHQIDLPAGTGSAFELALLSDTWNPADFGTKGFPSKLGIRVEFLRITPRP